jgi:hypothetical protein
MYLTTQQACWCIEYAALTIHDQNRGGLWATKYATSLSHGSILKLSIWFLILLLHITATFKYYSDTE